MLSASDNITKKSLTITLLSEKIPKWYALGRVPLGDSFSCFQPDKESDSCESIIYTNHFSRFYNYAPQIVFPEYEDFRYQVERMLFLGRLMFHTVVIFTLHYVFMEFDGSFYGLFKQYFENTFLPLYKQHVVFDGSLFERADLEYIIVFQRYPYWLEIKVYFTAGCAYNFDSRILNDNWFDLVVSGYFFGKKKEILMEYYANLMLFFSETQKSYYRGNVFSMTDLRYIYYGWHYYSKYEWSHLFSNNFQQSKTVFDYTKDKKNLDFHLYIKERGNLDSYRNEKKYGYKKTKKQIRKWKKRFKPSTHETFSNYLKKNSFHFPKELAGLSAFDETSSLLQENNKTILRRFFCGLSSTEYLFAEETCLQVTIFYEECLGIFKRFDGSNYFTSGKVKNPASDLFFPNEKLSLLLCPDRLLESAEESIVVVTPPVIYVNNETIALRPLPWYKNPILVEHCYNCDIEFLNNHKQLEEFREVFKLTREAMVVRWIYMIRRENLYGDWFSPFLPQQSSWIKCNQIWFVRKVRTTNLYEKGWGIFELNNLHFFTDEEFYSTKYGPEEYKVEKYEELEDPYISFLWFKQDLICPVKEKKEKDYEKDKKN